MASLSEICVEEELQICARGEVICLQSKEKAYFTNLYMETENLSDVVLLKAL